VASVNFYDGTATTSIGKNGEIVPFKPLNFTNLNPDLNARFDMRIAQTQGVGREMQ